MEGLQEDEEVIIEGSDLHKALIDMGYTDFEFTSIKKNETVEDSSSQDSYKWMKRLQDFLLIFRPLKRVFAAPNSGCVSSEQLTTILKAENLLDDHAAVVQSILERNYQSFWSKVCSWSPLVASTTMLGVTYLIPERRKTLSIIMSSSLAIITLHRKYEDFHAIKCLKDLISLQNELYYLHKKGLRILKKGYQLRTDSKQSQSKFGNLEIDRLKYLQPVTETLLNSMGNVSRIYYEASLMLVKLLPKVELFSDNLSHFEDDSFFANGEITYSILRHLYYVYILTQSDTVQLLAFAYDQETWAENGEIPLSQLSRVICNLSQSLRRNKTQLVRIIEKYENCKTRPIQRKYRGPAASKWRDLYLNLDLLSRKVQTAYEAIGSILEEIEKSEDLSSTDNDFAAALNPRINEIYKQIDAARNFAEFNNLLMGTLQRSRLKDESPIAEETVLDSVIESDLTIVRDSDPQIIDEVFEEYITEEYLKPIYDENDEAGVESAKLDKLLAKNFMSELKEALIDKYKSMSEREAKALLQKYRETNGNTNVGDETSNYVNRECEKPEISRPPALPGIPLPPSLPGISLDEEKPRIAATRIKRESRTPVPLPRTSARSRYPEESSPESVIKRFSIPPPPPPSQIDYPEVPKRFSIEMPKQRTPAFVTFEEEFIGSGENSEEEPENSDCEEDQGMAENQVSMNKSSLAN